MILKKITKLTFFVVFCFFLIKFFIHLYYRNCDHIVKIDGGLGNQFFEVFTGKVLEKEYNKKICFVEQIFKKSNPLHEKNTLDKFIASEKINILPYNKIINIFFKFKFKKINLFYDKNININYQNNHYFISGFIIDKFLTKKYKNDIIDLFKLKTQLDDKNKLMLKKIKKYKNSVSIHIRRGDYLKYPQFNIVTNEYYKKAIKIFESMDDVHFFVFSNDINWVKKNLKINKPLTFVDINSETEPYFELELMKNCKHNITTNSTFSIWAAVLNQNNKKIVVIPKIFHRDLNLNYNFGDNWIVIDN